MAALLYLVVCGTLTCLAIAEVKSKNRTARLQLYFTLLCALMFCGGFALLVSLATMAAGQYAALARLGVLVLTAGTMFAFTRTTRRFRDLQQR